MITIGESNINNFYFNRTSNLNYDITSLLGGNLNIKDVKTTTESTLILTNDCNVYGWGINQYGELGLGHNTNTTELIHIASNISKIDCSQNHSLFLDLDGEVYSCGKNDLGQLGLSNYTNINTLSNINLDNIDDISAGDNLSVFKKTNGEIYRCGKLKYEARYIQIACGKHHTMFLTSRGNFYGCGENNDKQINSDRTKGIITQPTEITDLPAGETITQIACGSYHTMFLTSSGSVYGRGDNNFNQINSSDTDPITQPTKITDFSPQLGVDETITQIACGHYHTVFLTSSGNVYGCGNNVDKQVNSSGGTVDTPTEITNFSPQLGVDETITQIVCGLGHTMFLTSSGSVYGRGYNGYRQVNPSDTYLITQPTEIEITDFSPQLGVDETITQIACGDSHTIFLTISGNVYGCGNNDYNQVNSSNTYPTYPITQPTEITDFSPQLGVDETITEIVCGSYHTMFLTNSGNVYGCGNNDYNQINSDRTKGIITQPTKITDLPAGETITQIACGRYHTVFLTTSGNIYGCGYNEYKQVSEISDIFNEVINKKKIDLPKVIYNIENIPQYFTNNVSKILADNNDIYYVTNNNDIYKNYDFILRNSTFTDININDNKIYILDDINRLNEVDTTNIVPIIPLINKESLVEPQPIYETQTTITEYTVLDADADHLVAHYKFDAVPTDGATLTNYGSGGTAYDATLNISNNGIERLQGFNLPYRYYWKSDASNGNYISISPTILEKLYLNGHTICFWAKDGSISDEDYTVYSGQTTHSIYIRIHAPWGNNNVYYDNGNGGAVSYGYGRTYGTSGTSANELVFWTFTRENISSTQMKTTIYKNGSELVSATHTRRDFDASSSSSFFYIGYNTSGEFIFKNKSLEDFRIYDKVLTPTEIGYLANNMIVNPEYKYLTFTYDDTRYPKIDDDSTNLILQWKFDDADNLNYDSVSETNKGTLSSGVLSTTGQIETAIDFHKDGENLSYDIPTSLINFQNTSHSFTFWFNLNSAENTYGRLIELYNDSFQILGAAATGKGRVRLQNAFSVSLSNNDDIIVLNQWYHFAVIVDIETLDFKLYKNGVSIADFDVISITNTAELRQRITFGKMYGPTTIRDADGQIDDFRIYNKALSAAEITDLYNQYSQTPYTLTFDNPTECDILIVGGGGGGGNSIGGGGGAGGVVYTINQTIQAGTYTIGVGAGGIGIPLLTAGQGTVGVEQDGKNSFIKNSDGTYLNMNMGGTSYDLVGFGGGGGGVYYDAAYLAGRSGGSGGGAAERESSVNNGGSSIQPNTLWNGTIYVQGGSAGNGNLTNDGNYYAVGGGGAGGTIFNNIYNGKNGVQIDITGVNTYYAAGGGGGQHNVSNTSRGLGGNSIGGNGRIYSGSSYIREATSGLNGTGSGGGGGAYTTDPDNNAGSGGSGIVIIRYKTKMFNTTSYNGTYNKITKGFDNLFFKSLDNNIYTLNQTTNTNYGTTISELSLNKLEFFTDKIVDNIFSSKHKDNTLFVTSNNLIYNSGDLIYNNLILQNTDNRPKLINDIFDTDLVNIVRYKNDDGYYLRYSDKVLDNDKNEFIVSNIDSNNIKKIDRTNNSTVILTKEGTVYIYGNINSTDYNRIINIPDEIIIDISCGYEHVLFRTANKKLYVLGNNYEGQLGTGDTSTNIDNPQHIDINSEDIEDIICGYNNSIVKTNSNYYITGIDGTTQYSTFTVYSEISEYTNIKKIIARNYVSILDGTTFHGKKENGDIFEKTVIEDVYINNNNIFFKKTNGDIINEDDDIIYSSNISLTINKGIIDSNNKLVLSYKNNDVKIDTKSEYKREWIYSSNSTYYMGNVAIGKTTATDKLDIEGTLSTNYGKQFKITHPLDSNMWLYHSSIECPRNDNIYRGETIIKNGYVEVNIDKECNTTGGMIEGTFKKLNKNSQLFLQNNDTFDNVKGNIDNNVIKIYCENKNKDIKVNWIVIGERDDDEIKKLEITDISGCLICEHLISR